MPSDEHPDWQDQRKKIIGLGESSLRKSYYPELREKMLDLEKKNQALKSAYENIAETEEELRANYEELARREQAVQESEWKYRNLYQFAQVGLFETSFKNATVVACNKKYADLAGFDSIEMAIGSDILALYVNPEDRIEVGRILKEHGQIENHIVRFRNHRTKKEFWGQFSARFDVNREVAIGSIIDITPQKEAEEAHRESERLYRTLVETTGTGFVVIDAAGLVIDANQKYVELSGHERLDELLGRSVLEWTADYEKERNAQAVAQCAKTGVIRNFEVDYVSPKGLITPVEINATVVSYGSTIHILTLCRDISTRRTSEKALRDSEVFYRTVFNTTGSASIVINRDTLIIQANERFAQLSGYTVEELAGKHLWKEFVTHDEYQRMKEFYHARMKDPVFAPSSYEFRFITRYGTILYCIMHVAIVPGTGQIIISVVDITDRVIAEKELISAKKHLEAIYEGSPDLIFVHGSDGHIIDVNENVLRAFGMRRDEILKADPTDMSGSGYTTEMAFMHIREVLEKGQAEFNWVCRRRDGSEFPVEMRLRRIESVNERGENEPRVLAIGRDISEARRAERALEQARKKLGLLNRVIFQDIQSTVFALSAYIQLSVSSRDEAKALTYIDKEAFLISKIVSSLNFTKTYQDLGIHPPKWQNVGQVFLYAISHLDSLKIERRMMVEGLEIYADLLLEKVFFNLVENSFIHGQRVTEVSLTYRESGDGLVIILTDNGVGITDEQKSRIFEQGGGRGSGLGLFLAREILSITGITIRETGEAGKGVRFELLVPKGAYRFAERPKGNQ
ncbi:PAS domain S-box protein [Methanoregula sp.]|uniref:PAS domain-containing protein n=1 Tax=Methanoregula sp. TaxID=2052170 RepID=UPI0025E15C9E|nr:PAS domain S-box protein [Methanoregula sp.]